MISLSIGSSGDEVRQVERRLADLRFYTGAIDGQFGGGLQSAVKSFQRDRRLGVDGVVGPDTWRALFSDQPPPSELAIAHQPIAQRCLALTATFETSSGVPDCYCGLAGNFDKQGLSFGVLQWNIGQGTLQPLLSEMLARHPDESAAIFHDNLAPLAAMLAAPRPDQIAWALSIQDRRAFTIFEPWRGLFRALGRTTEFQAIQCEHADQLRQTAQTMCRQFGVTTERALALMFDICVQNGSIKRPTEALIRADFDDLPAGDPLDVEVARLCAIANRRAEAASRAYVEDVRVRKLTIANGHGIVHNVPYDLEQQFGIRLVAFAV
jgi:hypothetical protein